MTLSLLLVGTVGGPLAAVGAGQTAGLGKPPRSIQRSKVSPKLLRWKPLRWIQIGPLYDRAAAREMASELRRLGYQAHHRDGLFVAVEPRDTSQQALELASELAGQGFHRAPMAMIYPWTTAEDPILSASDPRPSPARTTSSLPSPDLTPPAVSPSPPGHESPPTQISFGIQPPMRPLPEELPSNEGDLVRPRIERLFLESSAPRQREMTLDDVHIEIASEIRPDPRLYLRLGVRADGTFQTGSGEFRAAADFDETYLQLRRGAVLMTAGWQKPVWGRLSLAPPSDILSTYDLTRYLLSPASERRVAPGVRVETYLGEWKADAFWLPEFRAAELAPVSSFWSPIDQTKGALLGYPSSNPILQTLIRNGTFGSEPTPGGGGGLRVSRTGGIDFGITAAEARLSLPYYRFDDTVGRALLAGADPGTALQLGAPTFVEIHPRNRLYGVDLGFEKLGAVWRLEGARVSDVPVTRPDLTVVEVPSIRWGAETELVPGPGFRINIAASGYHLSETEPFLDPARVVRVSGELDARWAHERWRARVRFIYGVTPYEFYLNPEIGLLEFEPYEIFFGYHSFDGDEITASGFFSDRDLVILGVRRGF